MELALGQDLNMHTKILFACSWEVFPLVGKGTKIEFSFQFEMLMCPGICNPESWIMKKAEQRAKYASHEFRSQLTEFFYFLWRHLYRLWLSFLLSIMLMHSQS